eukprot:gene12262-5846_t
MELLRVAAVSFVTFITSISIYSLTSKFFISQKEPQKKVLTAQLESKKHGIDFVRKLTEGEIEIICKSLENVREFFPKNEKEITWLNLFFNQKFTVSHPLQQQLDKMVNQLVEENSLYKTNYTISYGFLINPAGCQKYQQFHFDYTTTSMNIFVPMTKVTFKNATQFLRRKMNSKMDYLNNFGEAEDIMQKENLDFLEISQIACKPFLVTKMHPSTCHRGFSNLEDYDRVVFWITIDNHLHYLEEDTTYKEMFQKQEEKLAVES